MQIQVISATKKQLVGKTGKPYEALELAYKNLSFGGKVEGKQIMPFGVTQGTFSTLSNSQHGDTFEITIVKNAAGFNDWTNATKSTGVDPSSAGNASSTSSNARPGNGVSSPKSTYETPEERAKKQVYIVRQSSISSAISIVSINSKAPLEVNKVLEVASKLEDFVFGNDQPPVKYDPMSDLRDMDDDIPL